MPSYLPVSLPSCRYRMGKWGDFGVFGRLGWLLQQQQLAGGFKHFWNLHPDPWGNDPIWLIHIFQVGWFNHQLERLGDDGVGLWFRLGFRQALVVVGLAGLKGFPIPRWGIAVQIVQFLSMMWMSLLEDTTLVYSDMEFRCLPIRCLKIHDKTSYNSSAHPAIFSWKSYDYDTWSHYDTWSCPCELRVFPFHSKTQFAIDLQGWPPGFRAWIF